jgi:hypothetical protein
MPKPASVFPGATQVSSHALQTSPASPGQSALVAQPGAQRPASEKIVPSVHSDPGAQDVAEPHWISQLDGPSGNVTQSTPASQAMKAHCE